MDDYYNPQTRSGPDDLVYAGWRRRVGQWLRFEAVLAPWNWEEIDTVLDLGCGPAGLAEYMEATGREAAYTGVEDRADAVELGRERQPEVEIIEGDLFEPSVVDGRFDLVVAIGTQVDGRPVEEGRERRSRIRRLVVRCDRLAAHGAAIVVLKQEMLEARPVFGLEPALFGVTAEEMDTIGDRLERATIRREVSGTDRALLIDDGTLLRPGQAGTDLTEVHERVVEYARKQEVAWADIAWLWLESGYTGRARSALEKADGEPGADAELRHLADRIRREESGGGDR